MTLEEYARLKEKEMSDTGRRIMELEAQIWEDDKNDPAWVRRQNREHNAKIFLEIDRLRGGDAE